MQFSAYCSLYGCGTRTYPHQLYIDLENKILCHEQEMQALNFFVLVKFPVVKTYCKNQSRTWRFRGIQVNIYHVVICSSLLGPVYMEGGCPANRATRLTELP